MTFRNPVVGSDQRKHKSARRFGAAVGIIAVAAALLTVPATSAAAYNPAGGIVYQLGNENCLKGRGNCAVYPKSAELPSGRLVATFEKSTVVAATRGAAGQTLPVYASDDSGTSWRALSEVAPPAQLSNDPRYAKYTSNWTNPYLYTLPQDVGTLRAGTLLLASVVSGEDEYYKERKAADPSWVPSNDGDRRDLAIALFSSVDEGVTWNVVNVIAAGGWQGGSAGATGTNISSANPTAQVDPLWEPYLMVHQGKLVAYYSDENDYLGVDPASGIPILDPANDSAPDSHGQILVHKTWDGSSTDWSAPVVDVAGSVDDLGGGKTVIGGGRPGMSTVVPTTDGKWLLTYEYWGGGTNVKYRLAVDPLRFFGASDADGEEITNLPRDPGSRTLSQGGSPVLITLGDGRIAYNAAGSGNIWVNESGRSDGKWTEYQTPLGSGYSRNMQYVRETGRVVILQATWGAANAGAVVRFGEVDLGYSAGAYYQLVNRKTGQVIGTGGSTNDANIGNADAPDVVSEPRDAATPAATQYWHTVTKSDGKVTLLNKAGGREASIWTGNATVGQRIGQWVDNSTAGRWNMVATTDGYYRFQAAKNANVFLTGATAGGPITLQNSTTDGSQEWLLLEEETTPEPVIELTAAASSRCIASRAVLTGTVLNENDVPIDVTIASAYGTKSFTAIQPGKSASAAFTTRLATLPAGELAVTARATIDGVGVTTEQRAPYAARSC